MIKIREKPYLGYYITVVYIYNFFYNIFHRYDDTNPEAESKEYIDSLAETVSWLGWKPFKTTYSSDYFQVYI